RRGLRWREGCGIASARRWPVRRLRPPLPNNIVTAGIALLTEAHDSGAVDAAGDVDPGWLKAGRIGIANIDLPVRRDGSVETPPRLGDVRYPAWRDDQQARSRLRTKANLPAPLDKGLVDPR